MGVDKLVSLVPAQVLWVLTLNSGLTIIGGWSTLMVLIIFIHSIIKLLPRTPGCCEVNRKDLDTDNVDMDIYQHDVLISNKINVTELQSFHICHALNYYLKADLLITFVNQSYCTFD